MCRTIVALAFTGTRQSISSECQQNPAAPPNTKAVHFDSESGVSFDVMISVKLAIPVVDSAERKLQTDISATRK